MAQPLTHARRRYKGKTLWPDVHAEPSPRSGAATAFDCHRRDDVVYEPVALRSEGRRCCLVGGVFG